MTCAYAACSRPARFTRTDTTTGTAWQFCARHVQSHDALVREETTGTPAFPPREPTPSWLLLKPHGTWGAIKRHTRRGEPLCHRCSYADPYLRGEVHAA